MSGNNPNSIFLMATAKRRSKMLSLLTFSIYSCLSPSQVNLSQLNLFSFPPLPLPLSSSSPASSSPLSKPFSPYRSSSFWLSSVQPFNLDRHFSTSFSSVRPLIFSFHSFSSYHFHFADFTALMTRLPYRLSWKRLWNFVLHPDNLMNDGRPSLVGVPANAIVLRFIRQYRRNLVRSGPNDDDRDHDGGVGDKKNAAGSDVCSVRYENFFPHKSLLVWQWREWSRNVPLLQNIGRQIIISCMSTEHTCVCVFLCAYQNDF